MIGWLDCTSGIAGDMLLGALVDAGVPLESVQAAVDALTPEPIRLSAEEVRRGGLRATRVHVETEASTTRRTWADIRALLDAGELDDDVRASATTAFARLAEAEARVHGVAPDDVHFHEVGALDSIADIIGVSAALHSLEIDSISASAVAVGSGRTRGAHGEMGVPVPAVVELAAGWTIFAGGSGELTTPTGMALLSALAERTFATAWGAQPAMTVRRQGVGAGGRDLPGRPNVVRLLLGDPAPTPATTLVLEANVDDMDPRLWPSVLARMLDAGASDAWLVPIVMKKGRPAHTLSVLVDRDSVEAVRRTFFTETTTIGLRETVVDKRALERADRTVEVNGHLVRVKTATLDGVVVNAQPEYDDVVAAAATTGRPVKAVLADATAAARAAGLAP